MSNRAYSRPPTEDELIGMESEAGAARMDPPTAEAILWLIWSLRSLRHYASEVWRVEKRLAALEAKVTGKQAA